MDELKKEFDELTALVGSESNLRSTLADAGTELEKALDVIAAQHSKRQEVTAQLVSIAKAKTRLTEVKAALAQPVKPNQPAKAAK